MLWSMYIVVRIMCEPYYIEHIPFGLSVERVKIGCFLIKAFNLQNHAYKSQQDGSLFEKSYEITVYRELFTPVLFSPLYPCQQPKSNVSNYLFLNTTMSGQIQDWTKLFANVEARKLHRAKITLIQKYIPKPKSLNINFKLVINKDCSVTLILY